MHRIYTLSEAKAKFSEIINLVYFKNEKVTITKKGKAVAVISSIAEMSEKGDGLILATSALSEMDDILDDMVGHIYEARNKEKDRRVSL